MNWNTIVIVICILIAAFAVWKEYVRANQSRLVLRLLATITAIIALACIALPLTYQVEVNRQDKMEVLLLTEGFSGDSLSRYNTEKIFTLNSTISKKNPKAVLIYDLADLKSDSTITQIRILGDGLDKEELQRLDHVPVIFHPAVFKQGITAVTWNEHLKAGDEINVAGTYKNSLSQKIKLVLKGLSTGLDSVIIPPGQASPFNLKSTPKNLGKNVYNLLAIAGTDTLGNENIPLQIEPAKALNVLMLTASPDFESRFLKNWLSENGYAVAVRSAISKDKFNKEFINLAQFPLDHLSASVFRKFDVLIADLSVLKTLNGAEAAALQQEVTQKGLGVVIRADSTLRSNSWLQRDFPADRLAVKDPAPVSLSIQGKTGNTAKLNAGMVYLATQTNTQSLVSDYYGHVLAANTLAGAGKLVFTPLNNTFSWVLSGNKADYSALWSLLIAKAARKVATPESWTVKSAIPTVSNLVELQLESAVAPSVIQIDSAVISPIQNSKLPFQWRVNYWPQADGWQSVKQGNGALSWFYVYNYNDWNTIRALKKQADTKTYIANNAIKSNVTKQIHEKATIAVSKIYFYILLLIACAFLWLEARFQ
ncbi:Rossmann-fold NAD(P)-binding domain-containing protein [Mucilaginibacter ginsenosidivorax]|uniref:Aerotolerance regulator N-terminal domain-containing protein n=1 Tax=Mucilaginibacter ginsenosidivorax TaxID=862126 RepID=A0A5B8W8V1_9SPHI|nr:hypothetical protein [Mucilaginibacter ginsenosidivorax]QEC79989.1 hypothetical protein FSB76_30025 [Mucilaginibacter ginsenosidivorax]